MSIVKQSSITSAVVRGGFHTIKFIEGFATRRPKLCTDDLRRVRRFLFLEYEPALGSNVHATPIFEALKRVVPDAVTMVAGSRMAFEVFKHNPYIDYLVETPSLRVGFLKTARSLWEHLKVTGFAPEIVVTSVGNRQRSIAMVAFLAGPAIRLGYTFAPELYDVSLRYDSQQSVIDNNLRIVEGLGYEKQVVEPRVAFAPEDVEWAHSQLPQTDLDRPRVVFITQTSPWQSKSWPADRFVAVANYATIVLGACAIFVGTDAEAKGIEAIRSQVKGDSISLAGRTTISQLAAVLCLSDYAVSLDTGNMHIGRSVELPMVILAPAWQPAVEWLPLGFDQYRIFKGDDTLEPPPNYIMDEINVEQVIEALNDLFERYPASQQSRRRRLERSVAHSSLTSRLEGGIISL
jgi:ADP-heptose:LPS heptosyltransferase